VYKVKTQGYPNKGCRKTLLKRETKENQIALKSTKAHQLWDMKHGVFVGWLFSHFYVEERKINHVPLAGDNFPMTFLEICF
jgi:hypothetical protein